MEYPKVKLGEVCEIYGGGTPSRQVDEYFDGEILWATPTEIPKDRIGDLVDSKEKITLAGLENSSAKLLPKDTVLMTSRASIGNISVATVPFTTNQGFINFVCGNKVFNRYLAYWLFSKKSDFENAANGATFKEISRGSIKEFKIPLPPLETQRHIAAVLDRADAVRQQSRQLIAHYDELIQSVFLDMFGDPVRNEKGWEVKEIASLMNVGKIITYGIVQAGPDMPNGIPYIKTGDIKDGRILINQLSRTSLEIARNYERSKISEGDIVISIRATVGTLAITPPELDGANLTQGTARISPDPTKASNLYLYHYIKNQSAQDWIQRQVKGATFREITLQKLREMPVLLPPLSLQTHFANVVEQIEAQKATAQAELAQAEALFESLLTRAFRGELSRPEHETA